MRRRSWVSSILNLSAFVNSSAWENRPGTSPVLLATRSGVPDGRVWGGSSRKKGSEVKLAKKRPQTGSAAAFLKGHDTCMGWKGKLSLLKFSQASPSRLPLCPYGGPVSLARSCSSPARREEREGGGVTTHVNLHLPHSHCGAVLQAVSYYSWNAQGSVRTSAPQTKEGETVDPKLLSGQCPCYKLVRAKLPGPVPRSSLEVSLLMTQTAVCSFRFLLLQVGVLIV